MWFESMPGSQTSFSRVCKFPCTTRHGETLGFFIPTQKRNRKAEVEAMRAAAKELDAMIAAWGASEDELMREYKEIRRASREKKRDAK